jgi:hypothetical protein
MARASIERYFCSKNAFSESLLDDHYVDICLNTDISSGVGRAYKAIEAAQMFKDDTSFSPIEKDVRFVIKILGNMSRFVPQEFSAGVLLMHLEIIEKISI